jgi:hypothetical protein
MCLLVFHVTADPILPAHGLLAAKISRPISESILEPPSRLRTGTHPEEFLSDLSDLRSLPTPDMIGSNLSVASI